MKKTLIVKKEISMKTFKDLKFEIHPNINMGYDKQAEINFDNGYGVSVITGRNAYSDDSRPYELAVLKNESLDYTTTITNDVLGYLTDKKVTSIMAKVQKLTS